MRITSKNKRLCRVFTLVLIAFILIPLVVSDLAYATTINMLDGKLTLSDTLNNINNTSGTVTASASGSLFGKKTNTVTITNDSGSKAQVSFTYSAKNYNSFTVAGVAATSGTYSNILEAGASVSLVIQSKSGLGAGTATMTLSGFTCSVLASGNTDITFSFDNTKGSVTVNSSSVTNGETVSVPSTGYTVAATTNSGVTFLGWIDSTTNSLISSELSFTLNPTSEMSGVRAIFVTTASDTAWFQVGTNLYDNLHTAANSGKGKTVVLLNNGTLTGPHTIPSGVTLLIPYDSAGTLIINDMQNHLLETNDTKVEYRRLTMQSGASISVSTGGAISIGAQTYKQMTGQAGPYGLIVMEDNSTITVESKAFLYAWGYIRGSGDVILKSGATAYENLTVLDYPGSASSTSDLYYAGIFPLRTYSFCNIEVHTVYHAGSVTQGFFSLWGSSLLVGYRNGYAPIIGNSSSAFFQITEGTVEKLLTNGKTNITINGDVVINPLNVNINVDISSSSTTGVPLPSGFSIFLKDGGSVLANDNIILTRGTKFTVEQGATVDLNGKNIYVMDASDDPGGKSAPSGTNTDAVVDINGTVYASGGFYTSVSGASIISSQGTGVIHVSGTSTATEVNMKSAKGTNSTVKITAAMLSNADGSYTYTGKSTTSPNTYTYTNGRWVCGTHTYTSVVTAPTCTEAGSTTYTCSVCGYSYTESVAATGHSYSAVVTAPTCTEDGYTTHTCAGCNHSYVTDKISALGHKYNTQVTEPTCTDKGYTTHTCSTCGDSYKDTYVNALGHSIGDNYVCEVCNLFQFLGSNVFLGNNLDMWFAFPKAAVTGDLTGYYALVMQDGEETRIDYTAENPWQVETVGGVECYIIIYDGIAAKEMSDLIEVTVYNAAGEPVSSVKKDSIRDYAVRIMKKYPNNELLKYLIVDMLQYGAACQTRFGYKPDDLATSVLSGITDDEGNTYEAPSNVGEISNIYIQAANVITTSAVQFAVLLTDSPAVETATYTFLDHWGNKVEGNLEYDVEEKYYYIPGLVIADAASEITIIINGDADNAYKDSMKNYCDRMINKNSEDADVFEAFMAFSMSAKKYLEEGRGDVE